MKKFGTTFLMVYSILMILGCQKGTDYIVEYSTTGCFGKCEVLDMKLIGNKVYYHFIDHTEKKGLFYTTISEEQKNEISGLIESIMGEDIKEEYVGDVLDVPATYFKLSRGNDVVVKTNYDDHIAPKSLDRLYSKLFDMGKTGLNPIETKDVDFALRQEIGLDTFTPPPPPKYEEPEPIEEISSDSI